MAIQPIVPLPPPRVYKKSRGLADRDALLDVQQPIGGSNQIVPRMLDGGAVSPETTIQQAYERNYVFALAERYREALDHIRALAEEYATPLENVIDPRVGLDENLAALRAGIGTTVPTTDPLLLGPYAALSMVQIQATADARIAILNVETSLRYDDQGGARYACNCYAADYLWLHPDRPYLPRVWWTREGKQKLAAGIATFGAGDTYALNSNDLNRWFHSTAARFGWVKLNDNDIDAAQTSANAGHAVIGSAKGVTEAGHIVMFAPEDPDRGIVADRREGKIVENGFVRSQAGAVNVGRAVSYRSTNVFDSNHADAGIWRYDPSLDESLGQSTVEVPA